MTRTRLARATRNLMLILLISFGLGEVALRIVDRFNPSFVFYDTSYNRFRARPGSNYYGFPINSRGFHDLEVGENSAGAYRILAIGDSFAFGTVPYEHNYLTLLEEYLSRSGQPVEVLNMGIPRTGPMDHLALLVNEGLALEPDMVLLSVFVGNDVIETHRAITEGRRIHTRSYVLSLLQFAILVRPQSEPGVLHNRRTYRDDQPTFDQRTYIEILGGNAKVYLTSWDGFEAAVNTVIAAIDRIAEICRAESLALAVVLLPEETQLDAGLQSGLAARFAEFHEGHMDYQRPNRVLGQRLGEVGIDSLDLYPAFEKASATTVLYKPRDTHWNIAGNRLAADTIAGHLSARGLPPSTGDRGE